MPSSAEQRSAANRRVIEIFQQAAPAIVDIQTARDVIPAMNNPAMGNRLILHSGAPIRWEDTCGPMQGGVLGAVIYEGWAATLDEARQLCDSGAIQFESCHDHAAVAPMGGIISPSMPVWIVEDKVNQTVAYSNLNEGPGNALRYGANSPEVIERLKWMQTVLAPRLREAIHHIGGLPVFPLVNEALSMGDECHSRNHAALPLLIQVLTPGLLATSLTNSEIAEVINFMVGRDYFFLNLTMAACKAAWAAAEQIPYSSIVNAFSRNGVEFAVRVQGKWFTAPSPVVDGHYFPTFTQADANRDIGDSAITEASGLGGFAVGGAPAITGFIGGTVEERMAAMMEMYEITVSESVHFKLPILSGRGTPTGVDIYKVLETGICPYITTGIAHKNPGMGQIGAGRVRAPLGCFEKALAYLEHHTEPIAE